MTNLFSLCRDLFRFWETIFKHSLCWILFMITKYILQFCIVSCSYYGRCRWNYFWNINISIHKFVLNSQYQACWCSGASASVDMVLTLQIWNIPSPSSQEFRHSCYQGISRNIKYFLPWLYYFQRITINLFAWFGPLPSTTLYYSIQ